MREKYLLCQGGYAQKKEQEGAAASLKSAQDCGSALEFINCVGQSTSLSWHLCHHLPLRFAVRINEIKKMQKCFVKAKVLSDVRASYFHLT
jgi:hypothetical protein